MKFKTTSVLFALGCLFSAIHLNANEKITIGTVTGLESGDVACYIDLVDEQGKEFYEMGDFNFCEIQNLIGKKVKLSYEKAEVLADSCEGNPDCEETKTEWLISNMETLTAANNKINSEQKEKTLMSVWTSDFGKIEFVQNGSKVTGNYPNHGGIMKATLLDNGELEGYWIQPSSEMKCKSVKEGSFYWGTFTFHQITTNKFNGHYAYCDLDSGSGGIWNGKFDNGVELTLPQTANNKLSADMAAGTVYNEYRASFKHGNPVRIETDVTCDGVNDFIFGWEETMNPDVGGYHIAVVHQESGETQLTAEKLRIAGIEGGAQQWPEICKVPGHFNPNLTVAPADKEIVKHYKLPGSCEHMVAIDDGACDKLHIMWNPANEDNKRFIFFHMN